MSPYHLVSPPPFSPGSFYLFSIKKNKDPLQCSSYRPISLLDADVKVLAKGLSLRLESVLHPSVIHIDQTNFIKNGHSFFNIRRLFNIIYDNKVSRCPEVVVSPDTEKAFDRVEWEYLFTTLSEFGFGQSFLSWTRLLYSSPLSSVHTNNDISGYFPLHRGTIQGCPLSPLLFAVAIELLAIALHSLPCFKGITRYGKDQKVSLYADDLLLFICKPTESVPHILKTLECLGNISGYKLNLDKSFSN